MHLTGDYPGNGTTIRDPESRNPPPQITWRAHNQICNIQRVNAHIHLTGPGRSG
jgi:hypothetical protein